MDNLQQIQEQIAHLKERELALIQQKKAEVIDYIKQQIKAYGLTGKDLGFHTLNRG